MTRRLMIVGLLAGFLTGAMPVMAHEEYRIIGTIAKVTATRLAVTQASDSQTISMVIDKTTLVTRDNKKVAITELKDGLSVVVDATGDSLDDLAVLEVRIVPPPAKK